MQISLRLLGDISWCGESIPGLRSRALLHALVAAGNRGASVTRLVATIWEEDLLSNPRKALQVLVSRLRSTATNRIIERTTAGYRLGLNRDEVDILACDDLQMKQGPEARAAGEARMEGKDYVMQDGAVVEFRFNV